jgi:hypothetical protein
MATTTRPKEEEHETSCSGFCSDYGGDRGAEVRVNTPPHEIQDDVDLAKEMNDLTVDERERLFDEIHGVLKEREETPGFAETCCDQFDNALSKLSSAKRKYLGRAFFLNPSIQKDAKFKMMFLRADNYNARRAAQRMAGFFTFKRELFGDDKLHKTITLDDLYEQQDTEFTPPFMFLPYKDQVGRPIWFCDSSKIPFKKDIKTVRESKLIGCSNVATQSISECFGTISPCSIFSR